MAAVFVLEQVPEGSSVFLVHNVTQLLVQLANDAGFAVFFSCGASSVVKVRMYLLHESL